MKKVVVANWKSAVAPDNWEKWLDSFFAGYNFNNDLDVCLAVPAPFLWRAAELVAGKGDIFVMAQAVSPFPPGNYTGALPASWLKGRVEYVLAGHRERRKYFHETAVDIARQVSEARLVGLKSVLCVSDNNLVEQSSALDDEDKDGLLLAYTPDDAVSLEKAYSPGMVKEGVARVRKFFPDNRVLYGGGVSQENVAELLALSELSGLLFGRSCLDGKEFAAILNSL